MHCRRFALTCFLQLCRFAGIVPDRPLGVFNIRPGRLCLIYKYCYSVIINALITAKSYFFKHCHFGLAVSVVHVMPADIHQIVAAKAPVGALNGINRCFVQPLEQNVLIGCAGQGFAAIDSLNDGVFILRDKLDGTNIALKRRPQTVAVALVEHFAQLAVGLYSLLGRLKFGVGALV